MAENIERIGLDNMEPYEIIEKAQKEARKEGWKGGMENALEIIDMSTTFDDRKTHKEYIKKIKDAIQECIEYNS